MTLAQLTLFISEAERAFLLRVAGDGLVAVGSQARRLESSCAARNLWFCRHPLFALEIARSQEPGPGNPHRARGVEGGGADVMPA